MGTRMRHLIVSSLVAALFLAASAGAAPPDTPPPAGTKAGSITALLPTATIVRGPVQQPVTSVAKKGDDVLWNDVVRTDKGGRARITLLDQSILSVGSQAELRIIKHDAKSQQTSLEVGYGRVRMEVTPITQPGGSFEVKTPTAVAGVIGTTFGADSGIGSTTFYCISGTTMVGSSDPAIPGRVSCTAGMAAVVGKGAAPTTRPMTQQEQQQLIQDTEPAVIGSMTPDSLAPGSVIAAVIAGTQLSGINQVSSSNPSVTVSLNPGGTATSVSVQVSVAANATPGPATITLAKPTGPPSAAVFTILSPGQAAAQGPSIKSLSTAVSPTAGGVVVVITGANFDANTQVKFGGVAASTVTFVSSTQLNVTVPAENAGTVDITVTNGGGTTTLSGGFMFGGPVPAISPAGGVTVNPGAQVTLDGSGSSDTMPGTTISYSWTVCSPASLKGPPSVGTVLSAASAPSCTPAAGTATGTDSQFSLPAPSAFGEYFVRLVVTDNLGISTVMFVSMTVNQPTYLTDPLACTLLLAQAFATLQTGSAGGGCGSSGASTVLGYFDPSFPGLTTLQQSLQTTFPLYSSMQVHLVGPQASTNGNLSTVTANWQLLYTLKNDPACKNISPCQPPTYNSSLGSVVTVWTLTPGQGLAVTDFRYPNGFPQGTLPAVPLVIVPGPTALAFTSPAQMLVLGVCSAAMTVQSQDSSGNPLPVGSTETLSPSGPAGTSFFTDSACTTAVTSSNLTIATGANSATFYMTTTVTGSLPITVTGSGAFTATVIQVETAGTILIASSQGNTTVANQVELNGPLADALTLTATRSDSITKGSVTLTLTGATITSTPSQLISIPYATPEPVDFAADIDASGNVTIGPATVTVTPSNATPPVGSQPTTLFFNIGDISLSGTPSCLLLTAGQTAPFTFFITGSSGFNLPTVNWQWAGFPAGVSVNQVNGSATATTLPNGTYNLPNFVLTSTVTGSQTLDFDVTITNAQGQATKVFALNVNLSTTACPAVAGRVGAVEAVPGTWRRGFGGGMARLAPGRATGALPDLQLNATSVSFTPSIPTSGETVDVRFRVTNVGNADAQQVPIALVVNGAVVASNTFDLRAGASTLAAIQWSNANAPSRSPQAAVVVDPSHTVPQASTLGKSAPLAHFAFLPASGAQTGMQAPTAAQRVTLEVADGGCAGFSFASGGSTGCGSADVEITVEQLASGRFTLAAQNGIADLGTAFGGGKLAGVQYQPEVPGVAGHSYAVQLGGAKTGVLRLVAIRNPSQTSAQGRQAFGASSVARGVGAGSSGPVETGDVSGVRPSNQPKAYFEVSFQTQ